ncbi:MAG: hypothetical protein ABI142_02735 [Bryocella sp.]
MNVRATFLLLLGALLVTGCHKTSSNGPAVALTAQQVKDQRAERESQREELDMIPPPSKSRFMVVHTYDTWENPWLTMQSGMITVHVLRADTIPTQAGAGGLLRPKNARREDVSVAPEKLADAIAAIPQTAWPYGRVVAMEEAHKTPKDQEPAVRRTMETAMSTLSDLGVSVYDPVEGKVQ